MAKPRRSAARPRPGKPGPRPESKIPATYLRFIDRYPELGAAHDAIGQAVDRAGPLDPKVQSLIKIGLCVGAGLESALRSHVRRALRHGATTLEIEQAILLGMNTVGFPRTAAAWSWAQTQFERED